ncbi:aminotransferase class IV [Solilutibacter silvestris]|uniref:branched-chain-amino-acid transaminase n=1 Tax=Solilutibacter silvestris TaxID=1645665 RepID=A0A2K1Q0B4_9GAMM|nr:aminotransferase class IV [Lysobacter silvestris]PNS08478.1 Branched-chain amino acid aminotransferase/4-amino-4-deoxychorismate lyase [Lysobacter silvestris]
MSLNEARAAPQAREAEPAPARETPQQIWFDGRFVDAGSDRAPLTTHAMHYGSGVFEGIRAYATTDGGSAVFRLPEHLERMRKGCELLGIPFDVEEATAATLAVLRRNGHRDAYVRPLAWCGTGSIGLDVAPLDKHLMVATFPTNVHLSGAKVKLGTSSWRRNPATSLPPLKLCGAYVNSILAKHEAKQRGFNEALFVDDQGRVVECTGANVFMVRDGGITAVEHRDALAGITRDTVIALTGAESRAVRHDELLDADEVFVVGTAAEVTPVDEFDDRSYAANHVGQEIAQLYWRVVRGEEARYTRWLTRV